MTYRFLTLLAALLSLAACDRPLPYEADADADGHTAPTAATVAANSAVLERLDFSDRQDFEDAERGLIASDPDLRILAEDGSAVWNLPANAFIAGEAPDSVNPSLWRQARLNNLHGLFEVTDGIYQLRGYDLSNMTLIEGETGWIVVDPLTARETAAAAFAFARRHLGDRPIRAMIFTHSHIDHFGGVLGVLAGEGVQAENIRIIAPEGFMEEATSENLIAGPAMSRRAMLMYGKQLARSPRGHVDSGLGISPAFGSFGLLEPTEIVDRTPQTLVIDGIEFVFQNAPNSEAPAELTFYLPHARAFNGAEVTSHNLHNLYTLRGAKIRDALLWSHYIDESMQLFPDAEIYLASHHWPIWGKDRIMAFLEIQRDTYKYLHDQTVRLFNHGLTPGEIAEALELPDALQTAFHNRGYYGTIRHNSRAVYQAYLGWYDGNPANLDPHPPVEAGRRYVELAGGAGAMLDQARAAFDAADYRWAAELLNHLVFADPDSAAAKALLAATYDQLGYQAESGPWRDVYLAAAYELRHGPPEVGLNVAAMKDVLRQTPVRRFFDSMAARLNGPDAEGVTLAVNFVFTDLGESYRLEIGNSVLHHRPSEADAEANATLRLTHGMFLRLLTGQAGLTELLFSDEIELDGSKIDLAKFFSLFDKPDGRFAIVTP
ncbi:MAG: MBL fold metallo-hydrolase [Xanthomonadales bacterium]|nr:MBL fold metallo-hydrolase [Gammaproteobacteria bacterium]NNK38061.1 MBL fold metallo-hydrolase [Xanthomonadales bacterium]